MIKNVLTKVLSEVSGINPSDIVIDVPEITKHGDYSTNIALRGKNPKETVEEYVSKLKKDSILKKIVSKVEIAGPGFINFWLDNDFLQKNIEKIEKEREKYGSSDKGTGKTVVIDYSSPNIAKEFSVGHLRSTIIGQALYNTYKFLGYKVIGDNHLGDWGTQFGMIIAQVIDKKLDPGTLKVADFEKLYVEFNKKAKEDPSLREKGKEWFKKLEDGDKKAKEIWEVAVKNSLKEFEKIYKLLGVDIDKALGESFYEDKMDSIVSLLNEKKISKKSEGAQIVEFKDMAPAILLKSDGGTTYFTRDLATIKYRLDNWNPDIFIYEVGAEQILHFRQVFETANKLGWGKEKVFKHVAHGLFLTKGKKMSTRKGTTVGLEGVLNEAVKKAFDIVSTTKTDSKLTNLEKKEIAKSVGIGSIKYFDLLHSPTSNIDFNWESIFNLTGNSASYLQYTFVRTQSVLEKVKVKRGKTKKSNLNNEELLVLRSLVHFSEIIEAVAKNYAPNLLCNYLFDLAQKYNSFYNLHKIIGSDNQTLRISITKSVGQVLKNGLTLLGIQAPERM